MGLYINNNSKGHPIGNSFNAKVANLIEDGAVKIPEPTEFQENLVCVIDNGFFAAAGYAFSKEEMEVFLTPDNRNKQWLKFDKAKELAQ